MKKLIIFVAFFLATFFPLQAQVAINTTNSAPNNFSMLDISATQKGVLIPRMTTNDRTTMAGSMGTTEEGLTVYDTDTKSFWFWDGAAWVALGSGAFTSDQDWFKEGTTNAPTDINDKMFHLGQVAIGQNTASAQLNVYSTTLANTLEVNNANTDNSVTRMAATFNVNGIPSTTPGITGVYASVGGDPGSGYKPLTGFETDITAQAGINPYQYGFVSDLSGDSNKDFVGDYNYIHNTGGTGNRYGVLNWISGTSSQLIFSNYTYIGNSGDGIHFGSYKRILGTGNGVQYGDFNRIGNSGSNKQIGVVNEIKTAGASAHVGTFNSLGAGVTESNPTNLVPITNDSDGKRVGTVNAVAGDGNGIHLGEFNNIFSSGNGLHIGISNVLGYDFNNNSYTSTSGYQAGLLNNITDAGTGDHFGTSNVLGLILDPANPTNYTAVTGDSNAKRIGELNILGGDGAGDHVGLSNNIISTGGGTHMGVSNILGYDYIHNTNTAVSGKLYGTFNSLTDTGTGEHIGNSSILGIIAPGLYVSGDSNAKRVGSENLIAGDGGGSHYGTVNHIFSTGDGAHIASLNKVEAGGAGSHIAVYGQVDTANDPTAMAGVFKGYTTSTNQVSTINLYSSNEYNVLNTTWQDLTFMEAGFDPTLYNNLGAVEVKVVVRVSSASGNANKFRLRAQNNAGANVTPISDTDTWIWTKTDTTNNKYVIESQWKPWLAGTAPWELHLQGITNANMKIVNVYVMVRPAQP